MEKVTKVRVEAMKRESEVDLEHDMNVDGGDTDDILMCNGLKWNVIDVITEDCRILPHTRAAIMWNNQRTEADRTILDYFQLSFPMQMVDDIVTWSSQAIPSGKPPMTSIMLMKLFGFLYAITRIMSRRRDLFSQSDGLFPDPRFGARFGLTQHCVDSFTGFKVLPYG